MPTKKSLQSKKTPPSQMIRVPNPLIEAVQKLSRLHRLGHTNAVLQGLQSLISTIDSKTDIVLIGASSEVVRQLALRLEKLESRDNTMSVAALLNSGMNFRSYWTDFQGFHLSVHTTDQQRPL